MYRIFAITVFASIALTLASPTPCAAEEENSRNFAENAWEDLKSPYTTPARPVLLWGSGLAIGLALLEDQISDPLQERANTGRPLGVTPTNLGALAGALIPNIAYASAMLIGAASTSDGRMLSNAEVMIKATIYSQLTTHALKYIVREPRPDGSGEKVSFPSGHATSAFSFASVIQAEHGWIYGGLAYTYATLVAYGRMNDNRHYLHDVVAGATIGASYGLGLYFRSKNETYDSKRQISVLPTSDLQGAYVSAKISF